MRKGFKFLTLAAVAASLVGCSCKKDDEVVNSVLNNPASVMSGSKTSITLSTQDIYDYVRENNNEAVNQIFLTYLMESILKVDAGENTNQDNKTTYNIKIKDYFEENYLESDDYKVNGVFNEDILASSLETQLFVVDKVNLPTSGPTVELGLKYDYSDFINRALKYKFYLEMLKEEYIMSVKPEIIDESNTRIISVYESDDLEDIEKIVDDLFKGEYGSLADVSISKKDEEKKEIGRQFCVNLGLEDGKYYEGDCSASTSSSTYDSALYKFTVCENGVRCTPSDGLAYQLGLIDKTEYVKEMVVNKNSSDILYEGALTQLLRDDVSEYLHEVIEGKDKFLVNGLYNQDETFNNRDIILSTGPDGKYYLVTVRVVDSKTVDPTDKERALELLLDEVSDARVIMHYFENLDVEVEDSELAEYYSTIAGK